MAEKSSKLEEKTTLDKAPILDPRATEKAYFAQSERTYLFFVDLKDSKQEIAKKVEDQFNVKVVNVRTLIRNGKKTRFSKGRHAYPGITFRRNRKLAYVTLAEGNSIRVFEQENEEKQGSDKISSAGQTSDKKSEKEAKKAQKSDAKAAKKAEKNAAKENK